MFGTYKSELLNTYQCDPSKPIAITQQNWILNHVIYVHQPLIIFLWQAQRCFSSLHSIERVTYASSTGSLLNRSWRFYIVHYSFFLLSLSFCHSLSCVSFILSKCFEISTYFSILFMLSDFSVNALYRVWLFFLLVKHRLNTNRYQWLSMNLDQWNFSYETENFHVVIYQKKKKLKFVAASLLMFSVCKIIEKCVIVRAIPLNCKIETETHIFVQRN